jgi:hypothetical protein
MRLHRSLYHVILLISWSILSGPMFPIASFQGMIVSASPVEDILVGRRLIEAVGSFHTWRQTSSKVGQRRIVHRRTLSYLTSQKHHPEWARLPISFKYTHEFQLINSLQSSKGWYQAGRISSDLYLEGFSILSLHYY